MSEHDGQKLEATGAVVCVRATLDEIEANQRAFDRTRSLRKQYRLVLANEPLFARLGVVSRPLLMQLPPRGIGQRIVWWWLNRALDTGEPSSPPDPVSDGRVGTS